MSFYRRTEVPPHLADYFEPAEIGLELSLEGYIANLVGVFREVRRILRPDGTLWLNLGDCYAGRPGGSQGKSGQRSDRRFTAQVPEKLGTGLKPKDLVGIPWRVALALQADGWWLRSDIIWAKPNSMPESVADRPTKSHEYLFLLTKSDRYFYDGEAIREPLKPKTLTTFGTTRKALGNDALGKVKADNWSRTVEDRRPRLNADGEFAGANKRTVWTVATSPFPGAHFATFPPKLIEPCILAGTSARGACPNCGSPWERILERTSVEPVDYEGKWSETDPQSSGRRILANVRARREAGGEHDNPFPAPATLGWRQSCGCSSHQPIPCTVLDPFSGAGTTGLVCLENRRAFIGVELNPEYIELTRKRLACVQPTLF